MSRTKVTVKTVRNDERARELQKTLRAMKRSYFTVGVHEDAGMYEAVPGKAPVPVSKVALWLEEGTQFMPARPFFYPALANNVDKTKRLLAQAAVAVQSGKKSILQALSRVGFAAQSWVQNVIKSNVPPQLSKTYAAKREQLYPEQGTRTLIASGLLLRSVRFKVVVNGEPPVLGPLGPGSDPKKPPQAGRDEHGRFLKRPAVDKSAQRSAARDGAEAYKANRRSQQARARANPEAAKQAFDAQRRIPRPPKASP